MKIRNGFVSNSSSSSFVVIGKEDLKIPELNNAYIHNRVLMIPQTFGGNWDFTQCETFNTFEDRLNFAALVAWYKEGPNGYDNSDDIYTSMLTETLVHDFKLEAVKINFRYDDDSSYTYQDPFGVYDINFIPCDSHPSNNTNTRIMFKDRKTLRKFLYAPDSEIKVTYS